MKARRLICRDVRQIEVEEFELGAPPDDGILVQNEYTAVSVGTELYGWTHGSEPGRERSFPHETGYCNAGTVLEVGKDVKGVKPGDRVLVMGPGPIGIFSAHLARLAGAEVAIAGLPSDASRLRIAEKYGCTTLVEGVEEWARERDGLGCDGVIDAAGASAALKVAIDVVRPAGWISKVGWGPQPLNFSLDPLVQKNVTLQGSFSHNWPIWEAVVAMMASGQINVTPALGGTWPLDQWNTAFETMHSCEIVKAVLKP